MATTVGTVQAYSLVPAGVQNAGKPGTKDATLTQMLASLKKQIAVTTTSFDVVSSTTPADIPLLVATLPVGKFKFSAKIFTESNIASGTKFSLGGTLTATTQTEVLVFDASLVKQSRVTAFASAMGDVTAVTNAFVTIDGIVNCTVAGTFKILFSQNASGLTASKVLANSYLEVQQIS